MRCSTHIASLVGVDAAQGEGDVTAITDVDAAAVLQTQAQNVSTSTGRWDINSSSIGTYYSILKGQARHGTQPGVEQRSEGHLDGAELKYDQTMPPQAVLGILGAALTFVAWL